MFLAEVKKMETEENRLLQCCRECRDTEEGSHKETTLPEDLITQWNRSKRAYDRWRKSACAENKQLKSNAKTNNPGYVYVIEGFKEEPALERRSQRIREKKNEKRS